MLPGVAIALALTSAALPPVARPSVFTQVKVWIRVEAVRVAPGACFDRNWFDCNGADFFITASGGGGGQSPMFVTTAMMDKDVVDPAPVDWAAGPLVIPRPARLTFAVFDAEGPLTDTDGDGDFQNEVRSVFEWADIMAGNGVTVTVDLEPLLNVGERIFTFSGEHAILRVAVLAELIPGTIDTLTPLSAASFRPSDGTSLDITGKGSGGVSLLFTVSGPTGTVFTRTVVLPPSAVNDIRSATVTWSGRDAAGALVPPGTYIVTLEGFDPVPTPGARSRTIPEGRQASVNVLAAVPTPTLVFSGLDPGPIWAPETGPLVARISSNMNMNVTGRVFIGSVCGAAAFLAGVPSTNLSAGVPGTSAWPGTVPAGTVVTPGAYSLELRGTVSGSTVAPPPICTPFSVIVAPTPLLIVRHTPFLAAPGQTVTFTAESYDPTGLPRRVPRLLISAEAVAVGTPAPGAAPAPLANCTNATTCSATLTMPATAARLTWRADAKNTAGTNFATSGWRGQRVTDWSAFSGTFSDLAVAVDEALPGPLASAPSVDHARGFDIVFNLSTDFIWSNAMDLTLIGSGIDDFMRRLWGLEGNDTPAGTTFLARPDLVSVYIVPAQAQVSWSFPANICQWSVSQVAWADARGMLHRASCRDNAFFWSRSFSAKLSSRDVVLHELHHALFGLADEYADTPTATGIGGDGGYSPSAELPNTFVNLTDCTAVAGRPAGGCTAIAEVVRGSSPARLSGRVFWRLDDPTLTDIMDRNGRQRFADIRQALFREAACGNGNC